MSDAGELLSLLPPRPPTLSLEPEEAPSLQAEVLIDGHPMRLDQPARVCLHADHVVVAEPVVAFIQNEDASAVERWELKIRARCGDCGVPFDISPEGRAPRDGAPGVVLTLRPAPEAL